MKFLILLLTCLPLSTFAQRNVWQLVQNRSLPTQEVRSLLPTAYQIFRLNTATFNEVGIFSLPMPDGSLQNFQIAESPILSAELAQKMPEARTYVAKGIDDSTALAYLDWTINGFHGMIFTDNGTVFIDPYTVTNTGFYITYYKHHYPKTAQNTLTSCEALEDDFWQEYKQEKLNRLKDRPFGIKTKRASGSQKRTYRIAVAATGEYTQARGGTLATAQASILTTMNRVRGIYEKELAISFTLVDNTTIVYTDGATDPFNNTNAGTLIGQSQTEIDSKIGNENYDIGHTFSTGGGGLAGLGVVCRTGQKARGITGLAAPFNDPYDVDYVAHEIGHQFGGPHTFNGDAGNCAGTNRSASNAYETGSGSTIMAYAGICGSSNIQPNSDPYFHTSSYDDILDYSTQGAGNNCPVKVNMTNAIPVLTMPTSGFTIPKGTAFALTASATDANAGDVLYYCWEQMDLGATGGHTNASGSGPSFRSFNPTTNPTRFFPRQAGNPNLSAALGEALPTVGRTFNFRCTVRDRKTETSNDPKTLDVISGVNYGSMSFNVSNTAGPFVLTSPNVSNIIWQGGSTQSVTWNVNDTDLSPINATQVNILLSIDGGLTYPTTLASNVPNDGSQLVVVPNTATTLARVKVQPTNNIFFDISDANFTISNTPTPTFTLLATPDLQKIAPTVTYQVQIGTLNGFNAQVNLSVSGNPAGTNAVFGTNTLTPNNTTNLTIGNTTGITGNYAITITATSGAITKTAVVILDAGNLAPVASNNTITIQEDASYIFKITDFNYAGTLPIQNVRISAFNLPNGANISLGGLIIAGTQIINASSLNSNSLRFSPAQNAFGNNYASFDFEVSDGVFYSIVKYKMTINITPINDLPVITQNVGLRTFPQSVAKFTIGSELLEAKDVEDTAASLTFKVLAVPSAGKLLLNGTPLQANDSFLQSEIMNHQLAYQPQNNEANTTDKFTFEVTDSQAGKTSVETFNIDINENNALKDSQIAIYPNPADTQITLRIAYPSTLKVTLVMLDVVGKEVNKWEINKETGTFLYDINLQKIPAGTYILLIKTSQETLVKKFVKTTK